MQRTLIICAMLFASISPAIGGEEQETDPPPRVEAPATIGRFTFADLPWGVSPTTVTKLLAAKGFVPAYDKDGDVIFTGSLVGQKVTGLAVAAGPNGLQKVVVSLITSDNDARRVYRDLRSTLIEKYGPPTSNYEFFARPYFDGDGYETTAFRAGKAHFAAFWKSPAEYLSVAITQRLTVQVVYEGPRWSAMINERRAKDSKLF